MKKDIVLVLLCIVLVVILCARDSITDAAVSADENGYETEQPDLSPVPVPEETPFPTVKPTVQPSPSPTPTPSPTPNPGYPPNPQGITGQDIADFAAQFVGYNYKYGGADPEVGFDCSGLVYYCYGHYGIGLYRTANDQALNGVHVELDSLEPGDILCFYQGGSWIGHVGIYIGHGVFIHAEGSDTGVVLSELDARSGRIEVRRIIAPQ